ncbi:MAG: dynamin family protein [Lachnospiraceae bacterium]|nr:dynamin family protein [Lachnospiraceae bacterium]
MENDVICKNCGKENNKDSYFCITCGKFLLQEEFESSGISGASEMKLERIADNLKENPHINILWNDTVDAYARKVERIKSILDIRDLGIESNELNDKISKFLNLCRKPDFEIAFVGAVKAGKSTLINALLGKNYATTDPNPETAVLTKFRSSEQDYVNVRFYSRKEWNELWKTVKDADRFLELYSELQADKIKDEWIDCREKHIELQNNEVAKELAKWSSSKSAVHFFVKEIEVGISTLAKDFPKQVVFVDTPGLSDPVSYRSKISDKYIKNANAVLVCVIAKNLIDEEVKTVEKVMSISAHKKNKVFVIATQWDDLNDPINDWNKRKEYLSKVFTGKAFYPTREMAQSNILYSSAYIYNLCREYNTLERREKNMVNVLPMKLDMDVELGILSPGDIEKIKRITNIQTINQVIVDELVNQYSKLLSEDIKELYKDIRYMTERIVIERKNRINETITMSGASIQEIQKKIDETVKNRNAIKQCQKQLQIALQSLDKSTQKRLDAIISLMSRME